MLNTTTLRLALGMRGGVSLAVWIGGGVAELDHFRHASGNGTDYYSKLLAVGRYDCVEVDVMSGASAGGLNAVLAAAAMMGGKTTDGLQQTWLDIGGLRDLLDSANGASTHRSLLNGSYFLDGITAKVGELLTRHDGDPTLSHRLEVFLSATVLNGLPVPIVDDEFSSEEAKRSGALFHFRHFGDIDEVSDLLDGAVEPLSVAARTTASFPTAFEPMYYPIARNTDTGDLDVASEFRGKLQFDGTLQNDFVRLLDGGVVDNIPVARALKGLPNVPAHNATDRWLIYMQPSPDALPIAMPTPVADDGPSPMPGLTKVVAGIIGGFMSESILDDIEVIRQHNLEAVEAWRAWTASIGDLPEPSEIVDAANAVSRAETRAAIRQVDAARIMALLLDPARELQWRPIGRSVPRSPLGSQNVTFASTLRELIAIELERHDSVRPFAPIARTAAILTRWARLAELSQMEQTNQPNLAAVPTAAVTDSRDRLAELGGSKRATYQLMHLAQVLTSVTDWAALSRPPEADPTVVVAPPTRETQARDVVQRMADSAEALATSLSIAELVDALPLAGVSLAFAANDSRFAPLLKSLYRLDPPPQDGGADVVACMWSRLAKIAAELSDYDVSATGPESDVILADLARKVGSANDKQHATDAYLRLIDQRTVGVHHGIATGLPGPVKYLRIGGSNLSPLCLPESEFAFDGPRFGGQLVSADGSDVPAKLKLSGSDLANFSAFISQRWRENDWMWGRLDAAKSMVDVVCSGDRLPADHDHAHDLIKAAVLAPMDLADGVAAAWGAPLQTWVQTLWDTHQARILTEIKEAATTEGKDRLKTTKRVLVLRRHWEIVANELPVFADADLEPIERGPATLAARIAKPTETMDAALRGYEGAERSFGAVWGRFWLTALAIRAGYAFWAATPPRSRWKRWMRAPLKPLPVTLFATLLARNRGLLAYTVAMNVIVMPRVHGIGGVLAWAASSGFAFLLGWEFRGRKAEPKAAKPRLRAVPYERGGQAFVALSALAVAYGLVVQLSRPVRSHLQAKPGWTLLTNWSTVIDYYTLSAAAAGALAVALLWYCARWHFRIVSTLLVGFIAGFWTVFSRWTPPARAGVPWWRAALSSLEFAFGSMTWALLASMTLTAGITHYAFRTRLPIARYGTRATTSSPVAPPGLPGVVPGNVGNEMRT